MLRNVARNRTFCHIKKSRNFSNKKIGDTKPKTQLPQRHYCKRNTFTQTFERTMSSLSFVSTSTRGLTTELSIPVPWGVIAAKTWGDKNNSPVLCVHGWLDNSNSFDTLIPLLPQDKYYVCIDLPGNGLSSFYPAGMFYTIYDYTAVIHRVVNYFDWTLFTYIGHSLGGNIGGAYSATFPSKVDKLIILDSPGMYPFPATETCNRLKSSIEGYYNFEQRKEENVKTFKYQEAKERLMTANKALNEEGVDILLERGSKQIEDGSFIFRRDYRHHLANPVVITKDVAMVFFANIEAEVFHVLASDGIVTKYKAQAEKLLGGNFSQILTNSKHHELVEVEGKHHVHLCNPPQVAVHVTKFLNRPPREIIEKS